MRGIKGLELRTGNGCWAPWSESAYEKLKEPQVPSHHRRGGLGMFQRPKERLEALITDPCTKCASIALLLGVPACKTLIKHETVFGSNA
jgi:hypothetical protein